MIDTSWWLYHGTGKPRDVEFPAPPPWRDFQGIVEAEPDRGVADAKRGETFQINAEIIEIVNTAIYLRRPLLLTGKPGTGKSSLAYSIAHELRLGRLLVWPITTRTTLADGLYRYDAIGRLQEQQFSKQTPDIGPYLRLGPVGTALLPSERPRVLLIDEIDKSDIDLPNDLLHIFEEGEFEIPELKRLKHGPIIPEIRPWDSDTAVPIRGGKVVCRSFPLVILTSNGEREFPPAFLRRCLRITLPQPDEDQLKSIVDAHFKDIPADQRNHFDQIVNTFLARQRRGDLATDQLLNAIYLALQGIEMDKAGLIETIWKYLSTADGEQR